MKIYSLEYVSIPDGAAERIWHTNRRALERYARTLRSPAYQVRGVKAFDVPMPLTDTRLVAFLNAHCAEFLPAGLGRQIAPDSSAVSGG